MSMDFELMHSRQNMLSHHLILKRNMIYSTKQFLLVVNGVLHMENQILRIWHGGGLPKQMGNIHFPNFQHITRYGVRDDRKTRQ